MTLRISLGCTLLAILLGACQQTLRLDDRSPDASVSGTGGRSGSGGSGPSDAAAGSLDARCSGAGLIPFTPDTSQILVALDRSSAMGASFGGMGGESQLQVALDAIQTYVSRYSGGHNSSPSIQFAFLDFPDPANNCSSTNGCCASAVTTNYADFEYANTCSGPTQSSCLQSSNRPTAAALEKAYEYYGPNTTQHGNERYVLLITDDVPGGSCAGNSTCGDAITAVDSLSSIGVTTEVVAIGQGALCLSELATAQAVFPSPYYVVSTPMDLSNAIEQITGVVAQNSCRLTLSSPPTSGYLTVKFNNSMQMQDSGTSGNTWNYGGDNNNNNTRVYLHGMLCASFLQSLLQGTPSSFPGLQIYDGCPPSGHGGQSP